MANTKILIGLLTVLWGINSHAQAGFSRLWRIEKDGKISYALGTDHYVRYNRSDFPESILRIIESSRVFFGEVEFGEDFKMDQGTFERIVTQKTPLKRLLSPRAERAYKKIIDPQTQGNLANARPGLVAMVAQQTVESLDSSNAEMYNFDRQTLSHEEIEAKYEPYELDPHILNWAGEIIGTKDPNEIRRIGERDTASEIIGIDEFVQSYAREKGLKVLPLDQVERFPNLAQKYVELVDTHDMNRMLIGIDQRLQTKLTLKVSLETQLLSDVRIVYSRRNYFNPAVPPEEYARVRIKLDDFKWNTSKLPGLERMNEYDVTRHKDWVDPIAKEAEQGGVFVAVGIAHLVNWKPGLPSVLDGLRSKGFKISLLAPTQDCESRITKQE